MSISGHAVAPGEGRVLDLGVMRMRVLAAGDPTGGGFTLTECTGAEGRWSVPHLHQAMEESLYVLDGAFSFTVGGEETVLGPGGATRSVPRGTPHVFGAGPGGGRCLVLMVPGGLEHMFYELSERGADALRDPAVRAAVSARYDSVPV